MKNEWRILAAACALVIGVYACVVQPGVFERGGSSAAEAYYNLLVQGFRAGQLSLKKEVPPELSGLANPYDLSTSVHPVWGVDLSYYKGRLYLYFGVVPALILFWPYNLLTGQYLFHTQAVTIFCTVGFLTSVGLLCALRRRYFAEVSLGVVVACVLALGMATGVPVLLSQSDVAEVPISCGYMLAMLALGGIWLALHDREQGWRWLAAASVAYGLAVGARPNLLFGAVILLVPVAQAWRERWKISSLLIAATGPIMVIGLGLAFYNVLRFGSPFEFGMHYQLHTTRRVARQFFGLHHLWFNSRAYFLEPARWSVHSPFVQGIVMPPAPPDHGNVEHPFGIATNIPLAWLALGLPLAWRQRTEPTGCASRWFVGAVALVFGVEALTLGVYYCTASRFEVEFLPALMLLAAIGILGLDRALANRPARRRAARCVWGVLLGLSVAFNLFAGVAYRAEVQTAVGNQLFRAGKISEAFGHYQQALRINPEYAGAHESLGIALAQFGRLPEAIVQYQQTLQISPENAETHYNLGNAFRQVASIPEAIAQYQEAVKINPEYAEAYDNLGNLLLQEGDASNAVVEYGQALRINPDSAATESNLGLALARLGELPEAIVHYRRALQIEPNRGEAHYNLAIALDRLGRAPEAIAEYEQALRINPEDTDARNALAQLRARQSTR